MYFRTDSLISFSLTADKLKTHRIGFIVFQKPVTMDKDGLDKWVEKEQKPDEAFSKSLFPHERITLYSLRERILELEKMRDQILYELDRLKVFSENNQS